MKNKKMYTFLGWLLLPVLIMLFISPYLIPIITSSFTMLSIIGVGISLIIGIPIYISAKDIFNDYQKIVKEQPYFFSKQGVLLLICLFAFVLLDTCWLQYKLIIQLLNDFKLTAEMKENYLYNYIKVILIVIPFTFQIKLFNKLYMKNKEIITDDNDIKKSENKHE